MKIIDMILGVGYVIYGVLLIVVTVKKRREGTH